MCLLFVQRAKKQGVHVEVFRTCHFSQSPQLSKKVWMKPMLRLLLKKSVISIVFGSAAYVVIEFSNFYYLFLGNILLTLSSLFFLETVITVMFLMRASEEKRKNVSYSVRIGVGLLFVAEMIIRFSGFMQTYPERTDGRYFSGARNEKLGSWYWVHPANDTIKNEKKEFVFYRTTNSLGLSEKEILPKKDSVIRILALGDSFTEGVGLSYEKSWVKQMENRWKDAQVETVNAGIGGSDPVYEFAIYRDKLVSLESNIVIVTINSTDIQDISSRGGFERFNEDGTAGKEPPSWEWIYAANHLVRMFMNNVLGYSSDFSGNHNSEADKRRAVKIVTEVVGQFKQLTDQENAKLLIVLQPSLGSYENGSYLPFFGQQEIEAYLKSNEIDFVDASQSFIKNGGEITTYFWPVDTHFNEKGYAVFGKTVYEKIEKLEWLNESNDLTKPVKSKSN